jgi:hypothetical protein
MLSLVGTSTSRAIAVIPATLLILFIGLLWLLGLFCGNERRSYVIAVSQQAMDAVGILLRGSPGTPPPTPLAESIPRIAAELGAELQRTARALDDS